MVTVNETNREPDGTFEALEAGDSFTDPAGNTYTGRVGKTTEQVQEDAISWSDGYAPNFAGGN